VNLPLRDYATARGLQTDSDVAAATERWGPNHLAVHVPGFLELLRRQLIAPLAIFQVSVGSSACVHVL
jgi:hypothetical protein